MFNELNILKSFFEDPQREFSVRETAKLIGIVPATASKKLKELSKMGILIYRKERILDLYKANMESAQYRDIKVYYNLTKIRASGIIDFFDKKYLKPAIIFFGSGAYGYDVKESDFDFTVITEVSHSEKGMSAFEKKIGRKIQVFAVKDIKDLKNKHLINNVLSGIVLQGEIKWI